MRGMERQPDAGFGLHTASSICSGCSSAVKATLRDRARLLDVASSRHHDGKLVPAQAGRPCRSAATRRSSWSGHVAQHPVADVVAKGIVDILEPIEIVEQHGDQTTVRGVHATSA